MLKTLPLIAALALSPAAAFADDHSHETHHDDHAEHLSELDGLRALHGWTRAGAGGEALIFVELENTGDHEAILTGAEAAGAKAELVGFTLQNGKETYVALPPVPIQPGRELHLEPRAMAIRLTGLTTPRAEGDAFEIHLVTSLGEIELHVAVEAANATRHSHAGHNH